MPKEDESCYVLAVLDGPFGEIQQVSARMRPSEAAVTVAAFKPSKGAPSWIKEMRIIMLRDDVGV